MKYWVYKDSRILGPFDRNAVADLPGLDASTLVCAGEAAAAGEGDWLPAGDVSDLASLPLDRGAAWPVDDMSSTFGLLDKMQLDAAGLIGDDEFPGAAEDLFQDPDMKRTFGDLIAPRPAGDEAELRRARDRAAELTAQLELLYRRVAELEAGQTNLVHRLAEKELQLRGVPADPSAIETFLREAAPASPPAAPPAAPPAESSSPASAPPAAAPAAPAPSSAAPSDWAKPASGGAFPSFPSLRAPASQPPSPASALGPIPPAAPALPVPPSAPLAPIDWAGPPLPAPAAPDSSPAAEPPPPPAPLFEKKTFKIVPTVKSFRVVGADDAPSAGAFPAPETAAPPAPAAPAAPAAADAAAAPAATAFDWGASAPAPQAPMLAAVPTPAPISLTPTAPPPPPETAPPVESITQEALIMPTATPPAAAPPVTLSFGAKKPEASENPPMPAFTNPGRSFASPGGGKGEEPSLPPSTAIFKGAGSGTGSTDGGDIAGGPSTSAVLARLAKPAPAPETAAPRAPRSNKPFLIGVAVLVVVMAVVGVLFLRHPKDLKQMAELDDGKAHMGAEQIDDATHPPLVKPKMAAPPPDAAAAEAATRAASQAKLDAAVAMVKAFPLDGERGTVAQWLQFSYTASPNAGQESWTASEQEDKTYLVDYRFTPSTRGDEVHYLFEADMDRGFVIGKNLDAKSVLAGGQGAGAAKAKVKPRKTSSRKKAPKRSAHRAADDVAPKDVPLLPLPNEGELRPPAEDDGAFNSDTVNSGL